MISFLITYLKAKDLLKTTSFGFHKKADVRVKKIEKKGNASKIFIDVKNQIINF